MVVKVLKEEFKSPSETLKIILDNFKSCVDLMKDKASASAGSASYNEMKQAYINIFELYSNSLNAATYMNIYKEAVGRDYLHSVDISTKDKDTKFTNEEMEMYASYIMKTIKEKGKKLLIGKIEFDDIGWDNNGKFQFQVIYYPKKSEKAISDYYYPSLLYDDEYVDYGNKEETTEEDRKELLNDDIKEFIADFYYFIINETTHE